MIKKIIILLISSIVSIAQAELVNDKNENKVKDISLDVLLEAAPLAAQKQLLKNRKRVDQQVKQLYLKKILAEMAEKEGLDKEEMTAERLRASRVNALFKIKLNALRKSTRKDYSKYAKKIYQANKSDYPVEERVDAAHILISTLNLSDDQALLKAQKISQELAQGAKFTDLALKESDDKSVKRNQGELGRFSKGQMVKPFSEAVFAMKPGEISEPVKTKFGYHIIKLNKILPAGLMSYEEVKNSIINTLEEKDWQNRKADFFEKTVKDNEMKIDRLAVDEFVIKKLDELDSQ